MNQNPTDRQQMWLDAATDERDHGNDVAAGFFFLLSQPNEEESSDQRRRRVANEAATRVHSLMDRLRETAEELREYGRSKGERGINPFHAANRIEKIANEISGAKDGGDGK